MKFPLIHLGSLLVVVACVVPSTLRATEAQEKPKSDEKATEAQEKPKSDEKADPGQRETAEPAASPRKLPGGVLARVNGIDISVEDYSRFLLASIGKTKLRDLVDRVLVEQLARQLKTEVSPDDVARRVEEQIENRVRVLFRGDRSRFEKVHLAGLGMSLDEYRDFQAQKVAFELLLERCILERRKITDVEIQRQFEKTYGPGGVRHELRHILIGRSRGSKSVADSRLSDEGFRKKAESVLKEIREGAEFVDKVREHSEDLLSKRNDGRIPVYRPGLYGEEFDRAVASLSESNRLSAVVRSNRGYHIVYFLGKTETKLADRREEIVAFLRNKAPGAKEKQDLLRELRKGAKIEY